MCVLSELIRLASYQGFCHKCQRGYYYPDGDCNKKRIDEGTLKCAKCGYSPSKEKGDK